MRLGFENMNERFLRMDEKIDFTGINLERQIVFNRENPEKKIITTEIIWKDRLNSIERAPNKNLPQSKKFWKYR